MRERRLPLFVLLPSALTFLASLFLPWRQWHGLVRLPFVFYNGGFDGWIGVVGDVAVLLAVATVFACLAALVRPKLAASLPLGGLGVGLGYFAAAVAVQIHAYSVFTEIGLRNDPRRPAGFASHSHSFWAYGFYLGVAGGAVAGLCGLFLRRRQLLVRRPPADVVADAIGIGLLVSFLLPWVREDSALGVTFPGVGDSATAIGALVLLLGAGRLLSSARKGLRLALAVAVAILIGASASATPMFVSRAYGAWIAIGLAVALVAIEAARARSVRPAALPSGRTALRAAAALVLLIALFLPWERLSGAPQGFAASANGWSVFPGGVAGALALLLLLAAALLPELEAHALTIALAIAFLVSVIGTYLAVGADSRVFGLAWGSYVGFAATAALLLSVLGPFRPIRVDPHRALARAVPLAASLACLAGQLTATIHGTEEDLAEHAGLLAILREKAGRLIFNQFPTGVEVCPSMQHGGPYPATTDSRFTSVGTYAIKRFVRPIAFQNFPDSALPAELKNKNARNIWRIVDGKFTKDDV
jgi:hypothetical protein